MFAGLQIKAILVAAAVIAALGAFGIYTHKIKQQGYDNAIHEVEKQTEKAGNAAVEGARTVDACDAAGGVWSRSTGKCAGP